MGWTAATGSLGLGGWIAFAILFLWQLPHFMAISWMYREDYGRAGFAMLSVRDDNGGSVARQALIYSVLLLLVSVAPAFVGMAGPSYLILSAALGAGLIVAAARFLNERTPRNARTLFMSSNIYLLAMMLLLVSL
jgi:protoheme IX farnesyltransferase